MREKLSLFNPETEGNSGQLPKILLGIVVWNRADRLPPTLEAIANLTYPSNLISIVCVDGDSTDQTFELLSDFKSKYETKFAEIQVVKGGFRNRPKSLNYALSQMNDENYFWSIDSDTVVRPDSLFHLLALSSKGYDISVLGMKEGSSLPKSGITEVDTVGMWCMLVSAKAIRRVGKFDERLVVLPEDIDYCYRARKLGFKIGIDGDHLVEHHVEGRKPDTGWKRWTPRQRRSTAFILVKLIQFGPSKFPEGRRWLERLAIYFLIFALSVAAPFVNLLLLLPLLAFYLFRTYKTRSAVQALKQTIAILIMFPITLFALFELLFELKSPGYRRRRNRKLIGVDEP